MNECLGEITVFKKSVGPLTKHLALRDGKIVNDSSACFLAHGSAHRVKIWRAKAFMVSFPRKGLPGSGIAEVYPNMGCANSNQFGAGHQSLTKKNI